MLILLISLAIIWLAVAMVVFAACRMAARGDAELAEGRGRTSVPLAVRRVLAAPRDDRFATYG
jgi:hypothetical protein